MAAKYAAYSCNVYNAVYSTIMFRFIYLLIHPLKRTQVVGTCDIWQSLFYYKWKKRFTPPQFADRELNVEWDLYMTVYPTVCGP